MDNKRPIDTHIKLRGDLIACYRKAKQSLKTSHIPLNRRRYMVTFTSTNVCTYGHEMNILLGFTMYFIKYGPNNIAFHINPHNGDISLR